MILKLLIVFCLNTPILYGMQSKEAETYFDYLPPEVILVIWAHYSNHAETILKKIDEVQNDEPNFGLVRYLPVQNESFSLLRGMMRFVGGIKKVYLHEAIQNNNQEILNFLIRLRRINPRIDFNVRDSYGFSSLHRACAAGNEAMAAMILDSTQNVLSTINDQKNEDNFTPLHLAVKNRHHALVVILLSSGADPNLPDKYGKISLHHASCFFYPKEIIQDLLRFDADPQKQDIFEGKPPITLSNLFDNIILTKFT